MLSISVIVGLASMILWGVGDFFQSTVIRKIGEYKTMFLANLFGLAILLFFLFVNIPIHIAHTNLLLFFAAGFFQVIAIDNYYKAMKIGEIAIVTPISASYPIISVILMYFFLSQKLVFLSAVAIVVLIIGIFLTSTDLRKIKHIREAKGVNQALITLFIWGFYFFVLNIVSSDTTLFGIVFPKTGYFAMFFYTTLINGLMMISYSIYKKGIIKKKDLKTKKILLTLIITSFIYAASWIILNYGFSVGVPSIITPISSLYPMICVVLAVIFYKEKLVFNQKIGILTILLGLILISL